MNYELLKAQADASMWKEVAEEYREALIQMDEAICHGNPETAKRIAREAYGKKSATNHG